jgi:hypothetical protein
MKFAGALDLASAGKAPWACVDLSCAVRQKLRVVVASSGPDALRISSDDVALATRFIVLTHVLG